MELRGLEPLTPTLPEVSGDHSRSFNAAYRSSACMAAPILLQKRRHEQFAGTPLTALTNRHPRATAACRWSARAGLIIGQVCRHVRSGRPDLLSYQTRIDSRRAARHRQSAQDQQSGRGGARTVATGAGISSAGAPTPPPHASCWASSGGMSKVGIRRVRGQRGERCFRDFSCVRRSLTRHHRVLTHSTLRLFSVLASSRSVMF